jgi:hypothetical protein
MSDKSTASKAAVITEGYLIKGGVNPAVSQIPQRPAPPPPMKPALGGQPAPATSQPTGAGK